jgi:catechol 2,3-dioxygenase-like lactoylglutathione lyase family enzyme
MNLALKSATAILPVDDPARARSFYEQKLGLPHRGMTSDGNDLFGTDGGPMLQLMPVKDGKHSEHTAVSFEVSNIERAVEEMEANGVEFQDYDLPDLKTEHHIWTSADEKSAWFMDTENNILCVHQSSGVTQAEYQL